ncbi:hypothetical protein [Hyphomicrobium sp.]|uniref:hypothetical protein n=1 Tax=Hyphomicrobium sp. TaxID=82 RepID=UPI002E366C53|nr:hypothetical protein [Hyphomicrobium sp.]HEX2842915.1 hypothetical protein [Hyphomicrobium sp.]
MGTRSFSAQRRRWTQRLTALLCALTMSAAPGRALEEPPEELPALKACEKRLCMMVMEKSEKGDDFKCDAQKTWAKSTLEGGESKGVSWGFGDARCKANIKLERADIIAALTKPKHTVRIPAQEVNCVLDREGEIKPVVIKLAPKLTFKDGKADKVWINLETIEGPADVKSTIWTAAKLEDSLGIFHRPMIKSINKFLYRQCPKRYGPGAEAKADKKADPKDKAKAKPPSSPAKDSTAQTPAKATEAAATTPPAAKAAASAP